MKAKSPSAEVLAEGKLMSKDKINEETSSSFSIGELNLAESGDLATALGFDVTDVASLESAIFTCINEDNRPLLLKVFEKYPSDTTVLQVLLTTSYPNRDGFYRHDQDTLEEAAELLGDSLENLNALQIACLLGEEDIALDILEFVTRITEEIQSKKILYEFMGRIWGDGNTTLHLASFMGMTDLVTHLLELGATKGKLNNRKYKPVDCTNDQQTREVFENIEEVNPVRRLSLDKTSPATAYPFGADPGTGAALSASAAVPPPSRPTSEMAATAAATLSRTRSSSGGGGSNKPRSHRSGTASQKDFPTKMLARETKKIKSVKFDQGTLLLHLCQFPDENQDQLEMVKDCLGLEDEKSVCALDVNNTYSPQQWLTPLHIACSYGFVEVAKLLIERAGAAVNITDKEGWTPLHCACAEGQVEVVKLLMKCQGNLARKEDGAGKGWIYALDGPINLEQENDDGDIPEEVSHEDKEAAINLILTECKKSYPPPPRIPREPASNDEEGEDDEDEDEEDEEDDEPPPPTPKKTLVSPLKMDGLKRTTTTSKSPGLTHEKRPFETEVPIITKTQSDGKLSIPNDSGDPNRPPSPNTRAKISIPPPPSSPRLGTIAPVSSDDASSNTLTKLPPQEEPPLPAKNEVQPSLIENKGLMATSDALVSPVPAESAITSKPEDIIPFPSGSPVSGSQSQSPSIATDMTPKKEPPKLAKLTNLGGGMGGDNGPLSASVEGLKKTGQRKGSVSKEFPQSPSTPSADFVAMSGEQLKRPLQRRSSKSSPSPGSLAVTSLVSKISPNTQTAPQLGGSSALRKSPGPPPQIAKKPDALSTVSSSYSPLKTSATSATMPSQLPIASLQKSSSSDMLSAKKENSPSSSSIPVSTQPKSAIGSSEMLSKKSPGSSEVLSKKMGSGSFGNLTGPPLQKSSSIEAIAKKFNPPPSSTTGVSKLSPGSSESLTRPKDFSEDDLTTISPPAPVIIGKLNKDRMKLFDNKK